MNRFSLTVPASVACILGLGLLACNQHDSTVAPEAAPIAQPEDVRAPTAFERDWLALKAKGLDHNALLAAASALRAKHGLPPIPVQAPALGAGIPGPVVPAESVQDGSVPQALAKAAAGPYSKYFTVKGGRILYHFVHYRDVLVGTGRKITISAGVVDPGTDPLVIAFYKTTQGPAPEAYQVKIVAFNDDQSGTVDAKASWTNTTGSPKTVRVMSYVYTPAHTGKTSFTISIPAFGTAAAYFYSNTRYTRAAPIYNNLVPDAGACDGPFWSRIRLVKDNSQGYGGGMLAFNSATKTGGYIRETSATLPLGGTLPNGYPDMVLGFYEGLNYDIEDAEAGTLPYSNFYYYQEDLYNCPTP